MGKFLREEENKKVKMIFKKKKTVFELIFFFFGRTHGKDVQRETVAHFFFHYE